MCVVVRVPNAVRCQLPKPGGCIVSSTMSVASPDLCASPARARAGAWDAGAAPTFTEAPITWLRGHVIVDSRRAIQVSLGLIWLLDGILQLQSFMYGRGFIEALKATGVGQPQWVAASVTWAANTMQSQQVLFNTGFAVVQIMIGVGLLHRRTVKPALAASFVWAGAVWWLGEGFGMVLMGMASPLSGAPGAAILYAIVGVIVWPAQRPGGLVGVRGARLAWGALWLIIAWLWMTPVGSGPNAVSEAINGAPSGIGWLTHLQIWLVNLTEGHGQVIGLTLAGASATIGIAVAVGWHARTFLGVSVIVNLVFWIAGQGFGGIFAGGATDPNSAPLLVLLAWALYALTPLSAGREAELVRVPRSAASPRSAAPSRSVTA